MTYIKVKFVATWETTILQICLFILEILIYMIKTMTTVNIKLLPFLVIYAVRKTII